MHVCNADWLEWQDCYITAHWKWPMWMSIHCIFSTEKKLSFSSLEMILNYYITTLTILLLDEKLIIIIQWKLNCDIYNRCFSSFNPAGTIRSWTFKNIFLKCVPQKNVFWRFYFMFERMVLAGQSLVPNYRTNLILAWCTLYSLSSNTDMILVSVENRGPHYP